MTLFRYLLLFTLVLFSLPIGYANSISKTIDSEQITVSKNNPASKCLVPVEKIKKPVDRKKARQAKRKKLQAAKKLRWKQKHQKAPNDLGQPALNFWLIFAIAMVLMAILGAFIIGLGLAPWIVSVYVTIGAEIAAFLTLILVIWVDKPGDPAIVQFIFLLLGLVLINFLIGLAFIIWGLAISWVFGWIIGLGFILLAAIFLAIHLILSHIQASKD